MKNGQILDSRSTEPVKLQEFDKIDIIEEEILTLKFVLRINQNTEMSFFVECSSIDRVREVKDKVIRAMQQNVSVRHLVGNGGQIWLTKGNRLLKDEELLMDANSNLRHENQLESMDGYYDGSLDHGIYIHIQPEDVTLISVHFR
jgi:hypothetical protein